MAGQLSYTLTLDGPLQASQGLRNVEAAMRSLERTASGLYVPLGSAQLAAAKTSETLYITPTPGLSAELNRITGGAKSASSSMLDLRNSANLTRASLNLASQGAAALGNDLGVKLSVGALAVTQTVTALNSAAKILQVSVGKVVGVVALAVTDILLVVNAYQAASAGIKSLISDHATLRSEMDRGISLLKDYADSLNPGRAKAYGEALKQAFDAGDVAFMASVVARIAKELRDIKVPEWGARMSDRQGIAAFLDKLQVETRPEGLEKRLGEHRLKWLGYWHDLEKLAKAANRTLLDEEKTLFAELEKAAWDEAQKDPNKKTKEPKLSREKSPLSSLERMGFIMGGGSYSPENQTAQNTRSLVEIGKQTNKLLGKLAPAALVNN